MDECKPLGAGHRAGALVPAPLQRRGRARPPRLPLRRGGRAQFTHTAMSSTARNTSTLVTGRIASSTALKPSLPDLRYKLGVSNAAYGM